MQEDYPTISHYFPFKLRAFNVEPCAPVLMKRWCVCAGVGVFVFVFVSADVGFRRVCVQACTCVILIRLVGGEERMCSLSSPPSPVPLTVIGAILIAARWLVDGTIVMPLR